MTITEQLEGLLPADGNYTTKDERVIAKAVSELMVLDIDRDNWRASASHYRDRWLRTQQDNVWSNTLAFIAGIALALLVAGVW